MGSLKLISSDMVGKPNAERAQKRPPPENADSSSAKRTKRYDEKPQRANRRAERRELMANAKATWEQLRPKATTKEKCVKLVGELLNLLKDRIAEFVFRHDGSRIVQWMLAEGNDTQKRAIMRELLNFSDDGAVAGNLPFFVRLACDRYGHHLAFKMLRVCDKSNKSAIFERYLRGNTSHLIKNAHGADVLDFAYQAILNARQRAELVVELLYSRERKLLDGIRRKLFDNPSEGKPGPKQSIFADSLKLVDDAFRDVVVESASSTLSQLIDKESLLRFEVVHAAMKEYLSVVMSSYPKEKAIDMAVQLAPLLVDFTHSKAGIFVAVNCVKVLDAKHRKKVVRGLKTHIRKILENEYGHRLILALFEWVDDTRLVGKTVATEVLSSSSLDAVLNEVDDSHKKKRGGRRKAEKKGKGESGDKGQVIEKDGGGDEGIDMGYVKEMCLHKYGRMMFLNLFFGRDTRYLNPDVYGLVWEEIDEAKFGKTSKKDANVRRKELRGMFEKAVNCIMEKEMRVLLQSHWSAGIIIGAAQIAETRDGVIGGVTTCLRHEESLNEVLGNKCGRKTIGTLIKVGGKEVSLGIAERCGIPIVGELVAREDCVATAERLVTNSEWNEGRIEMERLRKKMC